jgi:hypothetical protein
MSEARRVIVPLDPRLKRMQQLIGALEGPTAAAAAFEREDGALRVWVEIVVLIEVTPMEDQAKESLAMELDWNATIHVDPMPTSVGQGDQSFARQPIVCVPIHGQHPAS